MPGNVSSRRSMFSLFMLVAWMGSIGCASPSSSPSVQIASRSEPAPYRIAIAHLRFAPEGQRQGAEDQALDSSASLRVAHELEAALVERGVEVVRAHNTQGLLSEDADPSDFHRDATRLARAYLGSLDVDALLVIELTRWSDRDIQRRPPRPAVVGFRATLHGGAEGLLLWSGEFSERQVTFFDDPWHAIQYPGLGTRWLGASELADPC